MPVRTKSVRFDIPLAESDSLADLPPERYSHIDPLQLIEVLGSVDINERTGSNESPSSVRDIDAFGDGYCREIYSVSDDEDVCNDGAESHSYIFAALDRILNGITEEETGGVEVDEFGPDPFESTVGGAMNSGSSAVGNDHHQGEASIDSFADIRVFTLGLVGHGHRSIPATVVKNSLERHLENVLAIALAKQAKAEHWTERLQIEGLVYDAIAQKNYGKAVSLYKVLEKSKEPKPHGETTRTLANLVVLYTLVGKEKSALVCAKRSLRMHREEMNKYEASMSLFLLGVVYLRFGRLEHAFKTWREALQIMILVFGYDHAFVAMLLNNLGCLHYLKGDLVRSMQLFSESLDINETLLSSSSINAEATILDISLTKGNIAMILGRNGKYDATLAILEEVVLLQECVNDERAQRLVAETLMAMSRLDDRVTTAGAISTNASSSFFGSKCELSEAAAIETADTFGQVQVEESKTSMFGTGDGIPMRRNGAKSPIDVIDGSDHLDTILLGSLENPYSSKQRVRAAVLSWFEKTLQDDEGDPTFPFVPFQTIPRKRARIPIDLDTNEAINAELHLKEIIEQALDNLEHEEFEEALDLFESSLYSHREKYGEAHHLVGTAIHNIGMVHLYAQNYPQALKQFQEAVSVRRVALGSDHPAIAASLLKIGMIFLAQSNPEGAKEAFSRAIKVIRHSIGYDSLQMARVLTNMGVANYEAGSHSDALKLFNEAHDIQQRLLQMADGENLFLQPQRRTIELALINSLCNIGYLQFRDKNFNDSIRSFEEASELRKRPNCILGPDVYCLEENLRFVGEIVRQLEMGDVNEPEDKRSLWALDKLVEAVMAKVTEK